jgi:hypothetical protein
MNEKRRFYCVLFPPFSQHYKAARTAGFYVLYPGIYLVSLAGAASSSSSSPSPPKSGAPPPWFWPICKVVHVSMQYRNEWRSTCLLHESLEVDVRSSTFATLAATRGACTTTLTHLRHKRCHVESARAASYQNRDQRLYSLMYQERANLHRPFHPFRPCRPCRPYRLKRILINAGRVRVRLQHLPIMVAMSIPPAARN